MHKATVKIKCADLGRNGEHISAMCILLHKKQENKLVEWMEVGQTELQYGQSSPIFKHAFEVVVAPGGDDPEFKVEIHVMSNIKSTISMTQDHRATWSDSDVQVRNIFRSFYAQVSR